MKIIETGAEGLVLFEGPVHTDNRGYFMEVFKTSTHAPHIQNVKFDQDNLSWSKKGVIRGMHLQVRPNYQGKFIRCLSGSIVDFAVDLRKESKTFKKWFSVKLDSKLNQAFYIPPRFAHGFQALEDSLILYKCTTEYSPGLERGIRYDCPELAIKWPMPDQIIISEKDLVLPNLSGFDFDEL